MVKEILTGTETEPNNFEDRLLTINGRLGELLEKSMETGYSKQRRDGRPMPVAAVLSEQLGVAMHIEDSAADQTGNTQRWVRVFDWPQPETSYFTDICWNVGNNEISNFRTSENFHEPTVALYILEGVLDTDPSVVPYEQIYP